MPRHGGKCETVSGAVVDDRVPERDVRDILTRILVGIPTTSPH